jgi:Cell division protein FtsI/penicillin-binding protein 2
MNREIKRVSAVVLAMFVALFVSTSVIQVGVADQLNANTQNARTLYDGYDVQRGSILVAGKAIAESVPSTDAYKYQRTYPQGPLYSAVTGFYPIDGAPTGIEGSMSAELSGTSNSDFLERLKNLITGQHPQGNSVETTIDPVAQKAAWDALGNYTGSVVLLQPKTGRILAMVSKPSFDPNTLAVHDGATVQQRYNALLKAAGDPLVNKAINDLNPPASTFKPMLTSAAFETGQYTPDSLLPNPASLTLPGTSTVVHNDSGGTCGPGAMVTIATAQILSCNIPMAELGMKLGSATIRAQVDKFGFNHRFDVPMGASESHYPDYGDDLAQVGMSSFGQADDTATALQMAMNSATIANGGIVMQPTLVDSIVTPNLDVKQGFAAKEFGRAISQQTAATEVQLLVAGVDRGVASNARIDGVQVGGKTGTAQHGPNDPYTLWFTGFAPANNPEYAVGVVVENGGGLGQSGVGNTVAAPVARKVLEAVLNK